MNTHAHEKEKNQKMITIVVGAIVVLLTIYVAFFKADAISLETAKVGGAENMNLVQQLYNSDAYKAQQSQAIQQALSSMNQVDEAPTAQEETAAPSAPTSYISKDKMDAIKKNGFIDGNKNARITVLEYSEFLCPYCKRQKDNKILEQLLEKYPNDVNNMFRSFIVHPEAKILSEAAECIGNLGGASKYYESLSPLFDVTDKTQAGLVALATSMGINESKMTKCMTDGTYSSKIDVMSDEGRTLFGVQGTPGNVIVDNEKGTYTLIAGAYPVDKFIEIIDSILAD